VHQIGQRQQDNIETRHSVLFLGFSVAAVQKTSPPVAPIAQIPPHRPAHRSSGTVVRTSQLSPSRRGQMNRSRPKRLLAYASAPQCIGPATLGARPRSTGQQARCVSVRSDLSPAAFASRLAQTIPAPPPRRATRRRTRRPSRSVGKVWPSFQHGAPACSLAFVLFDHVRFSWQERATMCRGGRHRRSKIARRSLPMG